MDNRNSSQVGRLPHPRTGPRGRPAAEGLGGMYPSEPGFEHLESMACTTDKTGGLESASRTVGPIVAAPPGPPLEIRTQ